MTRDLTPATLAAMREPQTRPVVFFEGDFPSGAVRLWSGLNNVTWDGKEWRGGIGGLFGIGAVEETTGAEAVGTSVSLSGIPLEFVTMSIDEARQGAPGKLWLGFLDDAGAVIADPVRIFTGRLDVPQIADDGASCTITITYENVLIDLQRPRAWRYTDGDQQRLAGDDRGFEFVAGMQEEPLVWRRGSG